MRKKVLCFLQKKSEGGIAAIFAVMLGTGALIGLIALTFDVGALYYNQQTLRESSSAAARGLAEKCAYAESQCVSQATATSFVQTILNNNSDTGLTAISEICGTAPLNACTSVTGRWMDCKAAPVSAPYVRVIASTRTSDGNFLNTTFAGLLSGNFGTVYQNRLWHCAQAEWLPEGIEPTTQSVKFNIALPPCAAVDVPIVLYPIPQTGTNPPPTTTCVIAAPGPDTTLTNVAAGYIGFDAPVGSCDIFTPISVGSIYQQSNTNIRLFCGGQLGDLSDFLGTVSPTQIPVHVVLGGATNKVGPNWQFSVLGFSDFIFLGYYLGGGQSGGVTPPGGWAAYPPGAPSSKQCKGSTYCFYGKYVTKHSFIPSGYLSRLIP